MRCLRAGIGWAENAEVLWELCRELSRGMQRGRLGVDLG